MADALMPSITVLMATYNGAAALEEQLLSLAAQSLPPTRLVISDDASRDATRSIIARFANAHPELEVNLIEGPCLGASRNFMQLLRQPVASDFLALSDQDDVWLPEKLAAAIARLQAIAPETPALYCGRTWEVDKALNGRRLSRGAPKPPGFRHALVQNIAGGNTMVVNRAGARILRDAASRDADNVVHDWWIYQIMTGVGGTVIFDNQPQMLYRQHANNVIGANRGLAATLLRARMVASGRFRQWCDVNIAALRAAEDMLTPAARDVLDEFAKVRAAPLPQRMKGLVRLGLYRQGRLAQASLYLAMLLKRL